VCVACLGALLVGTAAGEERAAPQPEAQSDKPDLTQLSLAQLADLVVTTVSKKPEKRTRVAAAVHVITAEDIRRSGVKSFPEALRLAPGVQVARATSSQWAIGIRGFASTLSRSLLVLMDGRSVYTPLFAGVYWDVQHTLLEDVARIEVVRGPGGTLWGANAVNGVVNLITKSAKETHGLYVEGGLGSEERGFVGARYGGSAGSADYRVYAEYFDRDAGFHPDGHDFDAWHMAQAGFRIDWGAAETHGLTLQGDLYDGREGQSKAVTSFSPPFTTTVEDDARLTGGNLLGRFEHAFANGSKLSALVYYDRTERVEANLSEFRDTFDLDVQHRFSPFQRHDVVWGVGYRVTADKTDGRPTPFFDPADRTDQLVSAFAQDEVTLAEDRLFLTFGAKAERNDYTGFELQPSGRLLWHLRGRQDAWAAVSRAVRTPSRADTDQIQTVLVDARGPLFVRAQGDEHFRSESAIVYEAGYRAQPLGRLALDVAGFYHSHHDLLGGRLGTPFVETTPPPPRIIIPVLFGNLLEGEAYGAEVWTDARPLARWRLSGSYTYLRVDVRPQAPTPGLTPDSSEGSSPRHQFNVRSTLDLPARVELDASFRYVGELPALKVPSYTSLDMRLAWRPSPRIEVAAVGQNLLDPRHREFGGIEVQRGGYGQVSLRW
jgi:iron complex outermembrane receptor protein